MRLQAMDQLDSTAVQPRRDWRVTPEPSRGVVLRLAVAAQVYGVLGRVRGGKKLHDA
jgi:hypothetical protein